jgi:hypothetical protein
MRDARLPVTISRDGTEKGSMMEICAACEVPRTRHFAQSLCLALVHHGQWAGLQNGKPGGDLSPPGKFRCQRDVKRQVLSTEVMLDTEDNGPGIIVDVVG